MRLLNFTIIKLTICLVFGILIGYWFNISLNTILVLVGIGLITLLASLIIAKKQFIKTIWFGTFTYILMILVGVLTTHFHNQKNFYNHYSQSLSKEKEDLKTITFRIREVLKPGNYYDKYVVDILKVDGNPSKGKSLLNIEKNTIKSTLKVDAIFITKTDFKDLIHPLNPHQFDYKNFLEKKYIYHQIFIPNTSLLKVSSKTHTLFGIANNLRDYINLKLKLYHFKPDELSIINALLLGQRQDISEEVYSSYTNAGAIHILAVSGLHVGIVLIILTFILKPLDRFKHGKLIKTILLVLLLWGFALIAGLSASVTRAVTMFSIVAIALNLKRPTNIYNTLAISVFIILLFKPLFLFDVGFQLSYLAVFAIVAIDPYLYNLWRPKNWFIDKYWHTLTITISAQFGIIPISLYYFHQFPGLFFISNLVIIPLLGIILGLGILVIFLSMMSILPQFIASAFGYIISLMNRFVDWISQQEFFLFKDIPFNILYVLASYLLIIFGVSYLINKRNIYLKLGLLSIVIFQSVLIFSNYNTQKNEFVIFHKSRYSLIGNTTHKTLIISHDFDSITSSENNIIKDYVVGNQLKTVKKNTLKPIYLLKNKTLLVIDSLGIYNVKSFSPDYVLLRQSPKINLNRLIDSIKPKYIIADGSNYKSYVERWEGICKKRKLPFHQTSEKGAFIINY
jgi:competence protein ComEC